MGPALPQNLPDYTKNKFILINGEKIYLDQCEVFKILKDQTITVEEKGKRVDSILNNYINLNTSAGRIMFVLCIVSILFILSSQNFSGFYILMRSLIRVEFQR